MERRNSRSPESGMRYHNAAARSIAITINRASSQVQNLIGLENLTQGRPPQANFCQEMASLNDRCVVRRLKLTEVMEVNTSVSANERRSVLSPGGAAVHRPIWQWHLNLLQHLLRSVTSSLIRERL